MTRLSNATSAGKRIRERRISLGIKQSELASRTGISPAYLSLIEHDRRSIGGKTLNQLARELMIDADKLSDGPEATLVQSLLRSSALMNGGSELEKVEDFADRFPGWANSIAVGARRIRDMELSIAMLTDRLSHDPQLAESLHNIISIVTAIQSSASILETGDLEPQWQARFQRNILEESGRLADTARRLASFLGSDFEMAGRVSSPRDECEAFLKAHKYYFPELETDDHSVQDIVSSSAELTSDSARRMAERHLRRFARDAAQMPIDVLNRYDGNPVADPVLVASQLNLPLPIVLRRLAVLPPAKGAPRLGLVECDASGAITFAKAIDGFPIPILGQTCPLWPLYASLRQPMVPIASTLSMPGPTPKKFKTLSICEISHPKGMTQPAKVRSTMLIIPSSADAPNPVEVGTTCVICSRQDCAARRDPSIVSWEL